MNSTLSRAGYGLIAGVALAALSWIAYNHWMHLSSVLPYLLLLACPLMHLLHGHHGHRRRGHGSSADTQDTRR